MSYSRQPNTVFAGIALKQTPSSNTIAPSGVVPVTLNAEIATTSSLGVVKVGSGLSVSPSGLLTAVSSGNCDCKLSVVLVDSNYTATLNDCYIGCTAKNITITLPKGEVSKLFVVKNQTDGDGGGSVKVQGSNGEKFDSSSSKTLGTGSSLIAVFDGTRWNLI